MLLLLNSKAMTRSIFVDSRDRISGTPSNFTIELKHTLNTSDRPHRMRIDHLRLPISIPTLTKNSNVLTVNVGGTPYSLTMPSRQYDAATFPQTLQNLLNTNVPSRSWAVSYDINTISLLVQANGAFSLDGNGTLNQRLMQHSYTNGGTFYRFDYCPLNGADVVFLCSDQFSSIDNHGPNGSHDVLLPLNITTPYGSVQEFSSTIPDWVSCPSISTNTLNFQLRNRSHELLSDYVQNVSFLLTID
jgi:hypothetical protein